MEADFTRMDSDRLRAEDAARDTGVKLSGKTMVTHKVDPVIDEARLHIAFDLLSSGSLRALGYSEGAGYSGRAALRRNCPKDQDYGLAAGSPPASPWSGLPGQPAVMKVRTISSIGNDCGH
jgi:hypothetical protein